MKRVLCICIAILMFISMFAAATPDSPKPIEITTSKPLPPLMSIMRICGLDGYVHRLVFAKDVELTSVVYTVEKTLEDHILYWFDLNLLKDEIREDEYLELIVPATSEHLYAYVGQEEMTTYPIEGGYWLIQLEITGEIMIIVGD